MPAAVTENDVRGGISRVVIKTPGAIRRHRRLFHRLIVPASQIEVDAYLEFGSRGALRNTTLPVGASAVLHVDNFHRPRFYRERDRRIGGLCVPTMKTASDTLAPVPKTALNCSFQWRCPATFAIQWTTASGNLRVVEDKNILGIGPRIVIGFRCWDR